MYVCMYVCMYHDLARMADGSVVLLQLQVVFL